MAGRKVSHGKVSKNDRQLSEPSTARPGLRGEGHWEPRWWVSVVCCGLAQVFVLWFTRLPLGVPGEWTWPRVDYLADDYTVWRLGLFVLVICGGVLFWLATRLGRNITYAPLYSLAVRLLVLAGLGSFWWYALLESAPQDYLRSGRSLLVLSLPQTEGYFRLALDEAEDLPAFLASYEERMAEGDVLHVGTHPPGLIVLHRFAIAAGRSSEWLTHTLNLFRPVSVARVADFLKQYAEQSGRPLSNSDVAALWMMSLFSTAIAALAVVPIFVISAHLTNREAAWKIAILWFLIPAVPVFLPKSDVLFPALSAGIVALLFTGEKQRWSQSMAAGMLIWCSATLSLAILPTVLFGILGAGFAALRPEGQPRTARMKNWFQTLAIMGLVVVICNLIVEWTFDLPLWAVWLQNLQNHAGFYELYSRSPVAWFAETPIELAFALGLPLTVAITASLSQIRWRNDVKKLALTVLPCVVLAVLWFSGKNRGEIARLWIFAMPWLLWQAATALKNCPVNRWRLLVVMQAIVCVATVSRIDGFGFGEFARPVATRGMENSAALPRETVDCSHGIIGNIARIGVGSGAHSKISQQWPFPNADRRSVASIFLRFAQRTSD